MSSPKLRTVRIFSGIEEPLFLGLPILFVLAALVIVYLGWSDVPARGEQIIDALLLTIGLQSAHNAFTFSMIRLPEFKDWIHGKKTLENKHLARKWLVIGAVLIGIYLAVYHFAATEQNFHLANFANVTPWQLIFFLFWSINLWHTFSQYYGLSMLYNIVYLSNLNQSDSLSPRFLRSLKLEKRIYRPLLFVITIYAAGYVAFEVHIQSIVVVLLGLTAIFALTAPILMFPAPLRRAKFLFSARLLLLLPFLFPSLHMQILGFAMNINHNFEYWLVYKKIMTNSRVRRRTMFIAWSTLGILIFVAMTLIRNMGFFSDVNSWGDAHPILRAQLIALTMAITTLHYFMDGDIFHFSDGLTRKYIAPLLLNNREPSTALFNSPVPDKDSSEAA